MSKTNLTRSAVTVFALCFALLAAAQPAQAQGRQTEEPSWSFRALLGALNPFVAATPSGSERFERVFGQEGAAPCPGGSRLGSMQEDRAPARTNGSQRARS
jgi:hypothetical protein